MIENIISLSSDDQSSENEQVRDCRGECLRSEAPSQSAFRLDECGYCRLQSSEPSPYIDCAKQCYRPGLLRSHMICGQCLRTNRTTKSSNEEIDCGPDCKKNGSNCPCEIDPSSCGCENVDQCYRVQSVEPKAVEKGVETQVSPCDVDYCKIDILLIEKKLMSIYFVLMCHRLC